MRRHSQNYKECLLAQSVSDWLSARRPKGQSSSPGRVKNFHFAMSSRPALVFTQPPIQWVPGGSFPGGKAARS
jgi:hypothetical protein